MDNSALPLSKDFSSSHHHHFTFFHEGRSPAQCTHTSIHPSHRRKWQRGRREGVRGFNTAEYNLHQSNERLSLPLNALWVRRNANFTSPPPWRKTAAAAPGGQTSPRRKLMCWSGRSKLTVPEYMVMRTDLHGLMMQKQPGRKLLILSIKFGQIF